MVFVDDTLENVQGSYAANMIGVHYFNAEQLANDLGIIGIHF